MGQLTEHGSALRDDLAARHGVSPEAVSAMMAAVLHGGGSQAQFDIPELGGMGQWSRGGMTMVGDMFNTGLQAKVAALCEDIAQAASQSPLFERAAPKDSWQGQAQSQGQGLGAGGGMGMGLTSAGWWPEPLGQPSAQGAQNDMSYAIFPDRQRLAVNLAGHVTVHDTGGHEISGISQQQGIGRSWIFTSQYGAVDLAAMPVVYDNEAEKDAEAAKAAEEQVSEDVTEPPREDAAQPDAVSEAAVESAGEDTWGPVTLDLPTREPTIPPQPLDEPERQTETSGPGAQPKSEAAEQGASSEAEQTPLASPGSEALYSGARLLTDADQIFAALQKLGDLHDINILTDEEFAAKKAELLARL